MALDAELADGAGAVDVDPDVVGRSDGQVGPRRAHHGAQRDLGRGDEVDVGLDGQLQHELAVLALADLEEGALVGGADVIALGVHEEDVGRLGPHVAPEDEGRRAVGPDLLERLLVRARDLVAQASQVQRRLEEMADGRQALRGVVRGEVAPDAVQHLLGRRQAPGRLDHEEAVGGGLEDVHLAVRADVVDTRVGPGVGQEDQSLVEPQGQAIGQRLVLVSLRPDRGRTLTAPREHTLPRPSPHGGAPRRVPPVGLCL